MEIETEELKGRFFSCIPVCLVPQFKHGRSLSSIANAFRENTKVICEIADKLESKTEYKNEDARLGELNFLFSIILDWHIAFKRMMLHVESEEKTSDINSDDFKLMISSLVCAVSDLEVLDNLMVSKLRKFYDGFVKNSLDDEKILLFESLYRHYCSAPYQAWTLGYHLTSILTFLVDYTDFPKENKIRFAKNLIGQTTRLHFSLWNSVRLFQPLFKQLIQKKLKKEEQSYYMCYLRTSNKDNQCACSICENELPST